MRLKARNFKGRYRGLVIVGLAFARTEYLVDSELQGVVDHSRDENLKQGARLFEAWVCVNFNEPAFVPTVY